VQLKEQKLTPLMVESFYSHEYRMVVKLLSREAEALFERGVRQFYLVPCLDPPLGGGHAVCSKKNFLEKGCWSGHGGGDSQNVRYIHFFLSLFFFIE
jgi:hypothetical protein